MQMILQFILLITQIGIVLVYEYNFKEMREILKTEEIGQVDNINNLCKTRVEN